jgi:hypothetical protein
MLTQRGNSPPGVPTRRIDFARTKVEFRGFHPNVADSVRTEIEVVVVVCKHQFLAVPCGAESRGRWGSAGTHSRDVPQRDRLLGDSVQMPFSRE